MHGATIKIKKNACILFERHFVLAAFLFVTLPISCHGGNLPGCYICILDVLVPVSNMFSFNPPVKCTYVFSHEPSQVWTATCQFWWCSAFCAILNSQRDWWCAFIIFTDCVYLAYHCSVLSIDDCLLEGFSQFPDTVHKIITLEWRKGL